jgi:hypothetical protein
MARVRVFILLPVISRDPLLLVKEQPRQNHAEEENLPTAINPSTSSPHRKLAKRAPASDIETVTGNRDAQTPDFGDGSGGSWGRGVQSRASAAPGTKI